MGVLTREELDYLEKNLKRSANELEQEIVGAEWSEHCSYKSSKKYISSLPTKGRRVLIGPGYDAGILDIGDGHVLTVHIESHNHPSAVEPFGGAATGVGGVIRDIMSMGTRPIAILDALRFAPLTGRGKASAKSKWLFKNVVKGIADYGNCIGIPTVGGEVEFDASFEDYCLVDVASVGLGRKEDIVGNKSDPGDIIVLAGGSTGRDGVHGASFASKALEAENRSAVQIPDPFLEKLLLEATMEAVSLGCIKSIKDLGGGGLSCCLSETSDSLGQGFDVDLSKVHTRESGMSPAELMISESQERMLYVTDKSGLGILRSVLEKYRIRYSVLGTVQENRELVIRNREQIMAQMPSGLVAHAPLLDWPARRPMYLDKFAKIRRPAIPRNFGKVLLSLLSTPTIASKRWVYQQYDHEVGVRTVVKPGPADAALLRLDRNDKLLSVKLDGNSKHCFLDPYQGTLGCLSEGRRNVICTGAEPIGVVDHLQFASPGDPEVFWTFRKAIDAIIDYCEFMGVPVVGGKVSFYNETSKGPIKPTPVIGTLGLIDGSPFVSSSGLAEGESIFVVGTTLPELGGSEYYENIHRITGGDVPKVDLKADRNNGAAVLNLIRKGLVACAHDCSKGGLGVALAEMAVLGESGFIIDLASVPNNCSRYDDLMFSESHSRYLIGTREAGRVREMLNSTGATFAEIGRSEGSTIHFKSRKGTVAKIPLARARDHFYSLEKTMK